MSLVTPTVLPPRMEFSGAAEDFTTDPATLQFAMRVSLIREATNKVIATSELSAREPMREGNAAAGVAAANEAMARLLRELARFVVEKAH